MQAQDWLNNVFPTLTARQKITHLIISAFSLGNEWYLLDEFEDDKTDTWREFIKKDFFETLHGKLDLNDFTNLERLYIGGEMITELKIDQCRKLNFLDVTGERFLTSLEFNDDQKMITLKVCSLKPITNALTSKLELVKQKLTQWNQLLTN